MSQASLFGSPVPANCTYEGRCDNCSLHVYRRSDGRLFHCDTHGAVCSTAPRRLGWAVVGGYRCGNCGISYSSEALRDDCEYDHASS